MKIKLVTKVSKEFQIKLRPEVATSDKTAISEMMRVLKALANSDRHKFHIIKMGETWQRHGERYDTAQGTGMFKEQQLSLATEKRGEGKKARTKLKCKLHNFVPELLYRDHEKAFCTPVLKPYKKSSGIRIEPKFKLEQDIHFNNTKYCATGYLTLPGREHSFTTVKEFARFYPRLLKLSGIESKTPLVKVKDWNETVHDNIIMRIGDMELRGALVTRRDRISGALDESEFSFKLSQSKIGCTPLDPAADWNYRDLQRLEALYNEMFEMEGVFMQDPTIFYFANPVSSH